MEAANVSPDLSYFLLFLYLIFTVGIAYLYQDNKLGFWKGFMLCLFFTPVTGFFIYLITPDKIFYWDELAKLDKLKAKGKLNEEQYQLEKQRLMYMH